MFRYFFTMMYLFLMISARAEIINVPGDQPTVQTGIDAAVDGDTVLVADGAYLENIDFNGKAITVASHFVIDGDTAHISGTIITPPTTANPDSNSVVYVRSGEDTTSVLCGFSISGGTGTVVAGGTARAGGGILVGNSSGVRICHNIIENNTLNADRTSIGGGIGTGPPGSTAFIIIEHNWIRNNTIAGTDFGGGGGMEVYCSGRITDNIITGNILNSFGDATAGGGARIFGSGSVTIVEVTENIFANNKALSSANVTEGGIGGGLWIGFANAQVYGNEFRANEVSGVQRSYGGGIILHTLEQESQFYNNLVEDNYYSGNAPCRGGGLTIWRSNNSVFNNIFKNNSGVLGGAIYVGNQSTFHPELKNNTITGNTASVGTGLYAESAQPVVCNSIFWSDSSSSGAGEIFPSTSLDVQYSDVQGGYPGTGNIDSDPLFANPLCQLAEYSPCLGAGDPACAPPFDYGWNPRPNPPGSQPDMGAWESPFSGALHVPAQFATIQAAIDAAADGDVVLVADGQYLENINFKSKAITVASHFLMDGDTSHISNTVIDGGQPSNPDSGSVVYFVSGEDTNSVLTGFTITGGTGTFDPSYPQRNGGGIYCKYSGGSITHNHIEYNSVLMATISSIAGGGGIFVGPYGTNVHAVIEQNIIRHNSATNNASSGNSQSGSGGIVMWANGRIVNNRISNNISTGVVDAFGAGILIGGLPGHIVEVTGNRIINNTTSSMIRRCWGGGLYAQNIFSSLTIMDNVFIGNTCSSPNTSYGGGMFVNSTDSLLIAGNRFENNSAFTGGGIHLDGSDAIVERNFISNNTAISLAGGIYMTSAAKPLIQNNLIVNNSAKSGGGIRVNNAPPPGPVTSPLIINNTITGNHADSVGGSLYISRNSNPIVINSILWGNNAVLGSEIDTSDGATAEVHYSDIQGGWNSGTGNSNIDADPLFADTLLRISDSSPCIGAGIDSLTISGIWYYAPLVDFGGNPRPNPSMCQPDIGAWESPECTSTFIEPLSGNLSSQFVLHQNYPNPFNPTTTIEFSLPKSGSVTLTIYNISGEKVTTLISENLTAGTHKYNWDARGLASGMYFYKIEAGKYTSVKKALLLK